MDKMKKGFVERMNRYLIHKYDPVAMRRMDKDLKRAQVHMGITPEQILGARGSERQS